MSGIGSIFMTDCRQRAAIDSLIPLLKYRAGGGLSFRHTGGILVVAFTLYTIGMVLAR